MNEWMENRKVFIVVFLYVLAAMVVNFKRANSGGYGDEDER